MGFYERSLRWLSHRPLGGRVLPMFSSVDRLLLRASMGRVSSVSSTWLQNNILLLHTTGARSGKVREAPVVFVRDGENLVVIASRGGTGRRPSWCHNLCAHPQVQVTYQGKRESRTARMAVGEERDRLWKLAASLHPGFDVYQAQTAFEIPLFVLEPASQ